MSPLAPAALAPAALAAALLAAPVAADTVRVPASALAMGDPTDTGEASERPVHPVHVSAFAVDRREVTNAAFARFVAATGHRTDAERAGHGWHWTGRWRRVEDATWRRPHGPDSEVSALDAHPVVQVSWHDARAYCGWAGMRLPTEAEWERAARGSGGRAYAWGNAPPLEDGVARASYGADACCAADASDGHRYTAPVGSFPLGRSPLGIDDLTGNVWEWVEDAFAPDWYARSPVRDPVNREAAPRRVIRGGGWGNDPWGLRATLRHANPPDTALSMVGFRCAR